ncbi:Dihydrolipoamide acetyltransferase component of pyruvate dehydrogenase complex [Carbonactinospora thermoautotrophica]|uniref:Dihydrolipoamide acetyltransferase component of pyruvate dehydrogenase complex n=3 Tax=Carbonactinospora thermoautotrophica TaxID=1469144 RepID=A0A132MM02_9ACTN|nr:dihydrolipoamide acetyltransferase family protein [Carbonactinospora thermoautotrophica]KWW98451.1 Dihydrolipoamide acetyltransferase component of pyruvate dehydrogenase complex [Carbonactinospora thermoautotrophica]
MANLKQFKLPDVGEGLTEAEIVSWRVKPGDSVKVNDVIVEIETAKSLVELPCPFEGTVAELLVPEGQTVAVGTPIITIDVAAGSPAAEQPAGEPSARPGGLAEDLVPAEKSGGESGGESDGRQAVLVGYGPRTTGAKRRPRKPPAGARPAAAPADRPAPAAPAAPGEPAGVGGAGNVRVLAKPPVRKLAKDLGVDLTTVTPTGPGGTITRADVENAARRVSAAAGTVPEEAPEGATAYAPAAPKTYPFDPATREYRYPIKGVRRMTAQAMVASAFTAPHVTEFIQVDMTRSLELLERLKQRREFADLKLSPLLLVAKALLLAVRRNPDVNATWDEANSEIVVKEYVNLGIAVATPRGLVVPNIKGADSMTLPELARALNDLITTAREGRTKPADTTGGTITITNVGVFGVDTGTPILNPGEAAILAFGAIRKMPWVVDDQIVPRQVTTLALSFDHRLVDGEQGSKFLADMAAILEDPAMALVWS